MFNIEVTADQKRNLSEWKDKILSDVKDYDRLKKELEDLKLRRFTIERIENVNRKKKIEEIFLKDLENEIKELEKKIADMEPKKTATDELVYVIIKYLNGQ